MDNLILIYDNNRVTVDGSIDNCFTEDTSAKLVAQGWHVIDVYDGSNDVSRRIALGAGVRTLTSKVVAARRHPRWVRPSQKAHGQAGLLERPDHHRILISEGQHRSCSRSSSW